MSAIAIVLTAILGLVRSQNVYECPSNWYTYGAFCYKFEADIPLSFDDATGSCSLNGAGLLDIATVQESSNIVGWLQKNDPFQQEWYTSGVPDTSATTTRTGVVYVWDSTGEPILPALNSLWLNQTSASVPNPVIIYTYGRTGPGWILGDGSLKRPYICKISIQEAYRILQEDRGYDYGLANPDLANLEMGPHFIVQPQSIVVISRPDFQVEPVNLDCVVQANPAVTYRWFRGQNLNKEITDSTDSRYAITNGRLTITKPDENKDADKFQCWAQNKFGTIISSYVEISFGSLGEFSNVQDAGTRGKAYEGATVECSKIYYNPAVSYQWFKGNDQQFIRPQFQTYIFMSNNGKLYFSEITRNDESQYTCVAILTGVNRFTIGTSQPPMRTSLPIPLIVDDQAPLAEWGPAIQNDFIAVFPKPPLRGQDVRLECFAYGSSTSVFTYEWARDDKPMSSAIILSDQSRVLTIKEAKLEDSGIYRCTVRRGSQASDSKVLQLSLEAAPYFVSQLQDQHADIDSQLTWICNARGNPEPTYKWLKNGVPITTQASGGIKIQKNVLTIAKLDATQHTGMYQCGAVNVHGTSFTNAQLRVLAFAPNINKYPPPSTIMASNGGNITLRCQPEGSPFPVITWLRGANAITSDGAKYTIFANGNLLITQITTADSGVYTCKAVNSFGETQVSTNMAVTTGATITLPPTNQVAVVNRTVFLACEASFPPTIDMIYQWTFNTYSLYFDRIHYRQSQDATPGTIGLYILNVQFAHEGEYTCTARTPFNFVSRSAYLQVNGPPRQPAGVNVLTETVTQSSASVTWTAGSGSGGTVSVHIIETSNEFEPNVWVEMLTIAVADSYKQNSPAKDRHQANVTGLNPGTGYTFRIIALNEYGIGIPSDPSAMIQTISAPPRVYPNNVRGGGGSVGDLTIRWDPLTPDQYGVRDHTLKYKVYWRKKDDSVKDGVWNLIEVNYAVLDYAVTQVGADYYYLLYETKIQAINSAGFGPNSSIVEFYSAENLPIGVPEKVNTNTYNSSCIIVQWNPVPDDRVNARGKILGYVINYWDEEDDPNLYTRSIRYYGNIDTGLVIGLESQVNTIVDVQVYNSAGLGPRSNTYVMETARLPALHYSEEVRVASAGFGRARVWWRGITTAQIEEDITGYVIWLWTASENFRGAELIELSGNVYMTTLHNISEHRLYAMRIAATSFGGTGKKSPTVYFTTEGQILIDANLAETIQAFESKGITLHCSLILLYICCFLVSLIIPFQRIV
uniref:Contactin n=1 Tax=Arion vulgaris TaxID=1028688 RepID=A0A0B7B5Q8_9EUPU